MADAPNIAIEQVDIDKLDPAPYNPRFGLRKKDPEYDALVNSIEQFGLVEPLVANRRTGHVVGGHQRLTVLKDLGHTTVPVVWLDLDDTAEKQLNVALNRLKGRWDNRALSQLLSELEDLDQSDDYAGIMAATGFNQREVDEVLARADAESAQAMLDNLLALRTADADDEPDAGPVDDEAAEDLRVPSSAGTTDQTTPTWFTFTAAVPVDAQPRVLAAIGHARELHGLDTPTQGLIALLSDWAERTNIEV